MTSTDRARMADALLDAGPDAPTLCEGWTARDLAAHLVVRDSRPDALASLLLSAVVPPLRGRAAQVQREAAARPFADLVEQVRTGPPRWSPAALPAVDAAVSGLEMFVHAEDVRRAQEGWAPQPPRPGQREALWKALRRQARLLYRRSPVGVVLEVPAGPRAVVLRRPTPVTVTGQPEELVLHAFGRRSVARVEVEGPADAVRALAAAPLRV